MDRQYFVKDNGKEFNAKTLDSQTFQEAMNSIMKEWQLPRLDFHQLDLRHSQM